MKLVDILARELRAWPKGFGKSVGQCHHGAIHSCGLPYLQSGQKFTRCDNYMTDVVSMGQWQAAVDALKAEKVVEWNGEGLPPIGIDAEVLFDSIPIKYVGCKVLAHDDGRAVYRFTTGPRKGEYGSDLIHFTSGSKIAMFRPVRTPEQIAAEEIQKIRDEIKWQKPQLGPCPVEQMYLLGYRKFEIVDN